MPQSAPENLIHVGLLARSKELIASATQALSDIAHCTALSQLPNATILQQMDAIIFFLVPPYQDEVRLLARLRATDPFKLIILVTEGLDTQHQIEFLKMGLSDVTSLTSDHTLLGRKLVRAVHKSSASVMHSPILQALLEPAEPLPSFDNRRGGYRVTLPLTRQVHATLLLHPLPFRVKVIDVVIATDDKPAGFLLRESPTSPLPPELSLKPNQTFPAIFELEEGIASGQATVLRMILAVNQPLSTMITCTFSDSKDEAMIQKLWLDAQRENAKTSTPVAEVKAPPPQAPKLSGFAQLIRATLGR